MSHLEGCPARQWAGAYCRCERLQEEQDAREASVAEEWKQFYESSRRSVTAAHLERQLLFEQWVVKKLAEQK